MTMIRVTATWVSGGESKATLPWASTCADLRARLCAEEGLFLAQLWIMIGGAVVPPAGRLDRHADAETGALAAQAVVVDREPRWAGCTTRGYRGGARRW